MKTTKLSTFVLALIAILSFADRVSAGIIVVAPTAVTAGSLQITSDITFNITTAGSARTFVFDEWVISDGTRTFSSYSPSLLISINGNAPGSHAGNLVDNLDATVGQVTPNDGYLAGDFGSVAVSDIVTLKAGTYVLAAVSGFNPLATQTFTGNMFITDLNGRQLSNTVAVPEPTSLLLVLATGLTTLSLRRKRQR